MFSARRLRSSGSSPDRSQEPAVGGSCASGAEQRWPHEKWEFCLHPAGTGRGGVESWVVGRQQSNQH